MVTPLGKVIGEDGVGISGVTSAFDANGNTVVTVTLSDGAASSFTVNKGADGADNAGTLTEIIMNGVSKGTSGVVDLGTVITDISGKADASAVNALIGNDAGKSARTIANEELVAQLIPANAQAALDTLQEIAAWIQSHPNDAAAINQKLTLGTNHGAEYATVKDYVEAVTGGLIRLTALSSAVAGNGNAVTGVSYDSATGVFSVTKGLTFFTEHQDISGKVDKVSGKGLSTNDYTDADKAKVAASQAEIALLRELISGIDAPIYRTASGNPATFSDGYAANVRSLAVTLTPTQSGSGVPSPDNVRPISGASSVTVTRTGENGANPQSVAVTLVDGNNNSLTVYGGTLDVTAGTLTVTHGTYTFTGNEPWAYSSTTDTYYSTATLPGCVPHFYSEAFSGICDGFASYDGTKTWANVTVPTVGVGTSSSERNRGLRIKLPSASSQTDARTMTAGFQVVYPLETPLSYQLTPAQLATLAGYNAVSADSGSVAVEYRADIALSRQEVSS